MYYVKTEKDIYDLDRVTNISENPDIPHDFTFQNRPHMGQYILNGVLVRDSDYDTVIAPIIHERHITPEPIVPITIEQPVNNDVVEVVEKPQNWIPATQEELSVWNERKVGLTRLLELASNTQNYTGNTLIARTSVKTGLPLDNPVEIDVINANNNIFSVQDYINNISQNLAQVSSTIIKLQTAIDANTDGILHD